MTGFKGWAQITTEAEALDDLRAFVNDARALLTEDDDGDQMPDYEASGEPVLDLLDLCRDLAFLTLPDEVEA